jgi:hypothetical protein
VNAGFMAALDHVNALAEASDGFIWRLVGDGNDATEIESVAGDPDFIVNMSVWRDVRSLEQFAYRQADHRAVLARRTEWFDPMEPTFALWPIEDGHLPDVAEGLAMLDRLAEQGSGTDVFTFAWARSNGLT